MLGPLLLLLLTLQICRLIFCLLKIDVYLSVATGQCPSLMPEELDVGLPSSFALLNAHPLDEFFRRHAQEPAGRAENKFTHLSRSPEPSTTAEILVEDVQIGLCCMASSLWRFSQTTNESTRAETKAQLAQQLESWGYQLERISRVCKTQESHTEPAQFPLKAYFGQETEVCPAVLARVKRLLEETVVLQHAMSSYLYADMSALGRILKRQTDRDATASNGRAKEEQDVSVLRWAQSLDSKKACLSSITVLNIRESLPTQSNSQARLLKSLVDTLGSSSAVILRAWAMVMEGSCNCGENHNRTIDDTDPVASSGGSSSLGSSFPTMAAYGPPLCTCLVNEYLKRAAPAHAA